MPLTRAVSLTTRVTLLSATVVLVSVSLMAAAAYFVVYRAMYNEVDSQLESRADGMTVLAKTGLLNERPESLVTGTVFSTNISLALVHPDGSTYLIRNRYVISKDGRSSTEKAEYSTDNGKTWSLAYETKSTKAGE